MNMTNFEYMLALEETGSISGAAKKYFISPSAVSQCLKKEEQQMGCQLFCSQNHKMVPTEAGIIYLNGIRRMIQIREETYKKLDVIPKGHNSVRIAVAPMLYEKTADTMIPELARRFPDLQFSLQRTDSRVGLEYLSNDLADFALVCLPSLNHSILSEEILGEDRLVLIAPKAYLRSQLVCEPVIEDCMLLPFILLKSGSYMRTMENDVLIRHHISLNRIYEVDDYTMARTFLLEGRGATFLPSTMVPPKAEEHFFVIPLNPQITFHFMLVYPNYKQPDKKWLDIPRALQDIWKKIDLVF